MTLRSATVFRDYHQYPKQRKEIAKDYPSVPGLYKDFKDIWDREKWGKTKWMPAHAELFEAKGGAYLRLKIPFGHSKKWAIEQATEVIRKKYKTEMPETRPDGTPLAEAKYKLEPTVFAEKNLNGLQRAIWCYIVDQHNKHKNEQVSATATVYELAESMTRLFGWSKAEMDAAIEGGDLESRIRQYRRYKKEGEALVNNLLKHSRFPLK